MDGKDLRTILSLNMKLFRTRRKWSQADLAEKAKISITFLSNIERGNKWPYPDTLVKLASALDIDVFEFFKSQQVVHNEVRDVMTKFVNDVSVSLRHSVNKSVNQAVTQSLEDIFNQYISEG
ncbi:helix-turn-helix domain-containing protein [Breznakiellaceae bacterium SP9]